MSLNPGHQLVIMARLGELCRFQGATLYHERDPWEYMRRKLYEIEPAMAGLKEDLFYATNKRLLEELEGGSIDAERCADYKTLYEKLLAPGDFADVAIHLEPGRDPERQTEWCRRLLSQMRPTHLFIEERKPQPQRGAAWEKIVAEFYRRLDLDLLAKIIKRKRRTARRKAAVLRRLRRNVAEYCSVVRIPTDPRDTFTPFMLPRIEGLIAACLRFLDSYR